MNDASMQTVLLIEDNAPDQKVLSAAFEMTVGITIAECMKEAESYLAAHSVDLILLDPGLPDANGIEAVRRTRAAAPRSSIVVLTGTDDESLGLEALREGAQDFLIKGYLDAPRLMRSLRYANERTKIYEKLFVEKECAQFTLASIGDAVMCADMTGNITFMNAVAEELTGWQQAEALDRPLVDVLRILDSTDRQIVPGPMERAMSERHTVSLPPDCVLVGRDGRRVPVDDSVAPIFDRAKQAIGVVIVFRDVTKHRARTQEIAHSAQHDFLTGLPNRMLLLDRMGQAIALAERHKTRVAVLFLDLDGFKNVNDSLGHSAGDKLLQSVAARLLNSVRQSDTVSRPGGDEFIVLLSEVGDIDEAEIAAVRIGHALAKPYAIDDHLVFITASVGLGIYPYDGVHADTLIKIADGKMYQAKVKSDRRPRLPGHL